MGLQYGRVDKDCHEFTSKGFCEDPLLHFPGESFKFSSQESDTPELTAPIPQSQNASGIPCLSPISDCTQCSSPNSNRPVIWQRVVSGSLEAVHEMIVLVKYRMGDAAGGAPATIQKT